MAVLRLETTFTNVAPIKFLLTPKVERLGQTFATVSMDATVTDWTSPKPPMYGGSQALVECPLDLTIVDASCLEPEDAPMQTGCLGRSGAPWVLWFRGTAYMVGVHSGLFPATATCSDPAL